MKVFEYANIWYYSAQCFIKQPPLVFTVTATRFFEAERRNVKHHEHSLNIAMISFIIKIIVKCEQLRFIFC